MCRVTLVNLVVIKLLTRNLSKEEAPSEEELNKLGKEGWELAGVFSDSPFVHFYFKRMKD
jgi:hypothetical protein